MILSLIVSSALPHFLPLTCERTSYRETGDYSEALYYCRAFEAASKSARIRTIGKSLEGRDMVAVVLSADGRHTGRSLRASPKPVVLINNGIHAGEIEGKDACLILFREMVKEPARFRKVLKQLDLVMIPVLNVDGHERRSAFNRINQNGPREMGWRTNAVNLNLNRDFVKADAKEMRALLRLIHDIQPDFFFDNHTSNGADFQYHIMADLPMGPTQAPAAAAYSRRLYATVKSRVEQDGFLVAPYFSLVDRSKPDKGLTVTDYGPRYSTGYFAAINRPAMLVETHMLKPYENRVKSTFSLVLRTLEVLADTAKELKEINRRADRTAVSEKEVVVAAKLSAQTTPFDFLGFESQLQESPITGDRVISWTRIPKTFASTIRKDFEPSLTVKRPSAYYLPCQYQDVVQLLDLHGIAFERLKREVTGNFRAYRLTGVKFPPQPFEGRFNPTFKIEPFDVRTTLPKGTIKVPLDQARAKLIVHLLEPEAPDSLVRWGVFNTIFEVKEYYEDYAMEPLARQMLESNSNLRAEFEERLRESDFAKSPTARLQFFYDRSPYRDARLNVYPVLREE